ncbi:orotidine-5'-phosphate decarboxylase [Treponema pedis]|uniref:orotidine-5'-phosphate decarboxylase n=1 Tax=Treponema pedis TaxID=409322 RepID=UPI0003F51507|nr:orotidine-5'-phosphate decarboxylase [Treponema pedis]
MNYLELLKTSAEKTGNCACMGLDPQIEFIPNKTGNIKKDITCFFKELFLSMKEKKLYPAAFKPNIGYYTASDKPRENNFDGSAALSEIMDILEKEFKGIPVILDSKRGDIARSSLNYAIEAFDCWKADAVTVSPYMGSDSVFPFMSERYSGYGAYILNRTSNGGAADFQNLKLSSSRFLYEKTAEKIAEYAEKYAGAGAVVGATGTEELAAIAKIYAKKGNVPLLIPGVGSQGGSAKEVISILENAGYDLRLVRINSSSSLTCSWKNSEVPERYLEICINNIEKLLNDTKIKTY